MLPVQVEFPKFIPDQLLTSEDLNQLFGYLDEQNRMTRTNLIGIGIVCGLHLQIKNGNTTVAISKGCGVTSEGYLISVNNNEYSQYKKYKVDTPRKYDKFYKTVGSDKVPMDIWELRKPAVDPDLQNINEEFLKNKVILLFVELKEEDNKNCDPNSCDDKGINVTVSFLPMAVNIEDAALLMGTTGGSFGVNTYTALPELRMKRWDVPNTAPVYTQDIFRAYLNLLDKTFIDKAEATLSSVYTIFGNLVAQDFATNPFTGLSAKFNFLYNGSISTNQLIHLQYFYDLFSDLLLAYQEFRKAGTHVLSTCCPDSDLFPRHLLLGEAIPSVSSGILPYRHYFIYSPLFDQQNMLADLKVLFNRLALMIDRFFLPAVQGNNTLQDTFLRITPSMLWDVPLSQKAIPYYYQVNTGSQPLYLNWDHRRTLLNDAKRNLSYHASQYNASDDFVTKPLDYDLEPYNFLRIEGIVGKSYTHVLKQVKQQISDNRLPVDIIALKTDRSVKISNASLNNFAKDRANAMEMLCHFQDLESMYDSMRREILCLLCKELQYYYDFRFALFASFLKKFTLANQLSEVSLFDNCAKGYMIKDRSLGLMIEFLFRKGYTDETLTLENLFEELGFDLTDANNDDIPDEFSQQMSTIFLALLNFFKIPLGIIRLSGLLTEDLAEFNVKAYCDASNKLAEYAKSLKTLFGIITSAQKTTAAAETPSVVGNAAGSGTGAATGATGANIRGNAVLSKLATSGNSFAAILILIFMLEDFLDHLDVLIYNCKCSALLSLKKDYMRRYIMLTRLREFGYFSKMHPGLQHKAGVPMGGTFVIVYHGGRKRGRNVTVGNMLERRGNETMRMSRNDEEEFFIAGKPVREKIVSLAGIVVDEAGNPVAGATVSVAQTDEQTITFANGSFKFTGSLLPFTLVVEAVGYEYFEIDKTDDDTNIRIVLRAAAENALDELQQGIVIADFYLPYRCCSDCPPIQYIVTEPKGEPTPVNQGPVVNAGPDDVITLPTSTVTLNGTATDPDGSIDSFKWTTASGPNSPNIKTDASAQTTVEGLVQGVYKFILTVTDDKGLVASDEVIITVNPAPPEPNKPPVANAGPDVTVTLSMVTATQVILDAIGSTDSDGSIVAYQWKQIDGPTADIDTESLQQTVVKFSQLGKHIFQVTVTDNDGAPATDDVTVEVVPPANKPPVANAGPDRAVKITPNNNSADLDGSASNDPEGGVLKFLWEIEIDNIPPGSTPPVFADATIEKPTVKGLVPGAYEFKLTVTDDKNVSDSDSVNLKVEFTDVIVTPVKVCGQLEPVFGEFRQLKDVTPRLFPQFKEVFRSYNEVESYFKEITIVMNKPEDDQINFFAAGFNNQTLEGLLVKWLEELHAIIINPQQAPLRLQALFLYRVLSKLAMYIMCIKKGDVDAADIPLSKVFTVIRNHVKQWLTFISSTVPGSGFKQNEIDLIKKLGNEIEQEMKQVNENGETGVKTKYLKLLDVILKMIRTIP